MPPLSQLPNRSFALSGPHPSQKLTNHLPPEGKNLFQLLRDHQPVHHAPNRPAGQLVDHAIAAFGAFIALGERVLMMPQRVRSTDLQVDELPAGLPVDDAAPPLDRQAGPFDGVVEDRIELDANRLRRHRREPQPRRRDQRQIVGRAEEGPCLFKIGSDEKMIGELVVHRSNGRAAPLLRARLHVQEMLQKSTTCNEAA